MWEIKYLFIADQLPPDRWKSLIFSSETEVCNQTTVTSNQLTEPVIPNTRFSDFTHLMKVTACILRFVNNLRSTVSQRYPSSDLIVPEWKSAKDYWLMTVQKESFPRELNALEKGQPIHKNSRRFHSTPSGTKAGPTLLLSPLNQRFHIVGAWKAVRFITRQCVICKCHTIKPQDQLLTQLPPERVSLAAPFEKSGVDPSRSNMGT